MERKYRGGVYFEGPKKFLGRQGWAYRHSTWPFGSIVISEGTLCLAGGGAKHTIPRSEIERLVFSLRPWGRLRVYHSSRGIPPFVLFSTFAKDSFLQSMGKHGYTVELLEAMPRSWSNPREETNSQPVGETNRLPRIKSDFS